MSLAVAACGEPQRFSDDDDDDGGGGSTASVFVGVTATTGAGGMRGVGGMSATTTGGTTSTTNTTSTSVVTSTATSGAGGAGGMSGGGGAGGVMATTTTGGPVACYRDDQALVAPGNTAMTGMLACTATQINAFYQACFNGGNCAAFQSDPNNAACLGCMLGGAGNHYPPLLLGNSINGSSQVYVNVYACESMAQSLNQCAAPTSQFSHCVNTSCETCITPQDETACAAQAQSAAGICTQSISVPAACQPILNLQLNQLSPQCAGANFQALFTSASNYICGAG